MAVARKPQPASVLSNDEFAQRVKAGGASRNASSGVEARVGVDRGYMVGGKRTADGKPFAAKRIPLDQFTGADAANHLASILSAFPDDKSVYQGGWAEGNEAVLDASDLIPSRKAAVQEALNRPNDRGPSQDAIFDLKRGEDVPIVTRRPSKKDTAA